MVGFFREKNSFHVIFLVVIAFIAKLSYLLHPPTLTYLPNMGLLPPVLNRWYGNGGGLGLSAFLALVINLISALYANAVINSQRMFPKQNYIVAISMILMSSVAPEANLLTAPLLLLPLFIFIYQKLTVLYNTSKPRTIIYNIGFAAGVGILLYHPFIIFVLAILGGIASMRPFRIQELLILLLGFITPYYLYLSWQFLKGYWHPQDQLPFLHLSINQFSRNIYSLIAAAIVLLWVVGGFLSWQNNVRRMLIQARKNWNLLLLLVGLCAILIFIHTGDAADSFALAVFPFSCFASSAFVFPKKLLWPNLLFWIIAFVVMLVCLQSYEGAIV